MMAPRSATTHRMARSRPRVIPPGTAREHEANPRRFLAHRRPGAPCRLLHRHPYHPVRRPTPCCWQELKESVRKFRKEWELSGPMVQGISPLEAVERLRKFKEELQLRERKVNEALPSGRAHGTRSSMASGSTLQPQPRLRFPILDQTPITRRPVLSSTYAVSLPDRLFSVAVGPWRRRPRVS